MSPFQSLPDYEEYVYTIGQRFPAVRRSTLLVSRRGACTALLQGELLFDAGYRLVAKERLACDAGPVLIETYGYEVWCGSEKVAWYDSQPHPGDPSLAETLPHHKHLPPDIKHNRLPAPGMSFAEPNLPVLIREVEKMIAGGV